MCNIITYIIAGQLIKTVSKSMFFLIFGLIGLTGSCFLGFIKKPTKNNDPELLKATTSNQIKVDPEVDADGVKKIELTSMQIIELEVKTKDTQIDKQDAEEKVSLDDDQEKVTIKDTLLVFGDKKFQLLIPLICLRALMAAT
jgi:hypothetical protein